MIQASDELIDKVKEAVAKPLTNMRGGCFNPRQNTRGDCADGDCYCTRVGKHVATAAIQTLLADGWKPRPTTGETNE